MSAEETGNVPSALARRIAEAMNEMGFLRADTNIDLEAFEQAVRFLDREIAKAGAFIPADEYEMLSKAGQWREAFWHAYHRTHGHLPSGCSGCFKVQWALDEFTKPTRAARSEGTKP